MSGLGLLCLCQGVLSKFLDRACLTYGGVVVLLTDLWLIKMPSGRRTVGPMVRQLTAPRTVSSRSVTMYKSLRSTSMARTTPKPRLGTRTSEDRRTFSDSGFRPEPTPSGSRPSETNPALRICNCVHQTIEMPTFLQSFLSSRVIIVALMYNPLPQSSCHSSFLTS